MPASFKRVSSSHIDEIGYDAMERTFIVRWSAGGETRFFGVSHADAQEVWNAPSVGEAMHRHIRGKHEHQNLPRPDPGFRREAFAGRGEAQ